MTTAVRRRGPSKGEMREQAILNAARDLLEHKRLAVLTIDELAAAAGLSRSSFYFYFESKTAVLTALLDDLSGQLREENGPWLNAVGPAPDALRSATAHAVALWRTSGGLLRQAFTGDDEQLAAWRDAIVERGVARTAAKIERDRAAGLAPAGPPTAAGLARMLHGAKTALLLNGCPGGSADCAASGSAGCAAGTNSDPAVQDAALTEDIVATTLRMLYVR